MRKSITTAALALVTVFGAAIATAPTAGASTQSTQGLSMQSTQSCHVHQSGKSWVCVTPGAFCPAKAHYHFGTSRTSVRYECLYKGYHFRWVRH
jgi:hypothetical protein